MSLINLARLARRRPSAPAQAEARTAVDGYYYGGDGTIHRTGTIDVVIRDGKVEEVWFRCHMLPFTVRDEQPDGAERYASTADYPQVRGVELIG